MAVLFGVVQLSLSPSAWVGGLLPINRTFSARMVFTEPHLMGQASMSNEIDEIHQPIRIHARCLAWRTSFFGFSVNKYLFNPNNIERNDGWFCGIPLLHCLG